MSSNKGTLHLSKVRPTHSLSHVALDTRLAFVIRQFQQAAASQVETGEQAARINLGFGDEMTNRSIPAQSVLSMVVAIALLESDQIDGSTHPLESKRIHGRAHPALPLLSSPVISWKYCIVDPPTNQVISSNQVK